MASSYINYVKITENKALIDKAKKISNQSYLIAKNIISLKNKIKNLEIASKDQNNTFQEMLLEVYGLLADRVKELNFVEITEDLADIINDHGIDFVNLIQNGRIVENEIDLTHENRKTAKLLQNLLLILEELSGISKKNFLTGIFILKTLDPKLKTGRKLMKFKKDDYRVIDHGIYQNGANYLEIYLNKLTEISVKSKELLKSLRQIKVSENSLDKKLNQLFINYGKIRTKSKLLSNQCKSISNNIKKLVDIAKNKAKYESVTEMEKFLEISDDLLPANFPDDVKLIKTLAIKTTEKLNIHSTVLYIRIMNRQSKIYKKIINKILNYLNSVFILKEDSDFFNLKEEIKKMENKIKKVQTYLNSDQNLADNQINFQEKVDYVKENFFNKCCKKITLNFKTKKSQTPYSEEQQEYIIKKFGLPREIYDIKQTLGQFENNFKNDKLLLFAAIYIFTNDLAKIVNKLSSYVAQVAAKVALLLRDIQRVTLKKFILKISSVTSAIGTIGCFAGFAMTSICPVVGWAIFAVCSVAFIFNFANALYRIQTN